MRHDMKKVLTESPRFGHSRSYKEVRRRENRGDYDNLPTFQGMRAPHVRNYGGKEFSDHIMPLIRYLWGCIGRRWDDVWSEICTQVSSGNTVDSHLKGHVTGEIELNCIVKDGEVYEKPYRRWSRISKPRGLYVDPRDGLIKAGSADYHHSRNYYYKREREPEPQTSVQLEDGKFVLIDGIWYSFDYAVCPEPKTIAYIDEDGETKTKLIYFPQKDEYYNITRHHTGTYHTNKRQLSSRDLKKHGLQNTR